MSESLGGMPLLSGPPPELERNARAEMSCRKCNKEFNVVFTRGRKCNHCGYTYCHSCSDYQALMPRQGTEAGYDPMPVCAFCIQYLTITAGGKGYLRSHSLAKLKNYIQAYNIRLGADVLEKDDVINTIIAARNSNGCLPLANEDYYRKNAVPNGQTTRPRGLFSRPDRARTSVRQNINPQTPWARQNDFARPDLEPDNNQAQPQGGRYQSHSESQRQYQQYQQQQQPQQQSRPQPPPRSGYAPPPGAPPQRRDTRSQYQYQSNEYPPPPSHPAQAPYSSYRQPSTASTTSQRSTDSMYRTPSGSTPAPPPREPQIRNRTSSTPSRPSSTYTNTPAPPPPPISRASPPPPVPTLDELLVMPEERIAALSVSALKAVLFANHVPARLVLEKSELVTRVCTLLDGERRERARMEAVHEQEAWEAAERMREVREAREREKREAEERERRRRRAAYRATVESASEDEGDARGVNSMQTEDGPELMRPATPPTRSGQPSPTPTPTADVEPAPETGNPPPNPPKPSGPVERSGLCVVCQDEDANIVIVDCGHLALCRACADLVWSSTRECPLCRTRIVTESRLLRVFRT